MDAAFGGGYEGAFAVGAEGFGAGMGVAGAGGAEVREGRVVDFWVLGSEGWKERSDACFNEGLFYTGEVGCVSWGGGAEVEAVAAVYLDVDEAGGYDAVVEVDDLRGGAAVVEEGVLGIDYLACCAVEIEVLMDESSGVGEGEAAVC